MKFKKQLLLIVKLAVSALAIYIVFSKVNTSDLKEQIFQVKPVWFLLAILFFNLSKIVSAVRLRFYFAMAGSVISQVENLKLYYIGMFYNLFLPGGIGGDGYKVYLLHKNDHSPVKKLISSTLLDRLCGLTALVFLTFILLSFLINDIFPGNGWVIPIIILIILFIFPTFYLLILIFFKSFSKKFFQTNLFSLLVQTFQLVSAIFILLSLGINDKYIEYLTLFLVSSVVAVLPFTIGGVGARELVFLMGSDVLAIDPSQAVTFSMLFFIISAISSFVGVFLNHRIQNTTLPSSSEKLSFKNH